MLAWRVGREGLGGRLPERIQHQRRFAGQALEVLARIRRELRGGRDAHHRHLAGGLAQQARGHQPVAAVVALAANHGHRPVGSDALHGARHACAGALHQLEPGHALLLDRPAVARAHRCCVG